MKCPKCNFDLPPGETECPSCGTDCAYAERIRAQKEAKEQVTKKKKTTDDAKTDENTNKSPKIYITSENTANFNCPECTKSRILDVSKYKNIKKTVRLKYKCQCGHSYSVILERRRLRRKNTDLFGSYRCFLLGDEVDKGRLSVKDVSVGGMRLKLSLIDSKIKQQALSSESEEKVFVDTKALPDYKLSVGDTIFVEARLDDKKRSLVKQKMIIRWISGPYIGAQFASKGAGQALGFYLWD